MHSSSCIYLFTERERDGSSDGFNMRFPTAQDVVRRFNAEERRRSGGILEVGGLNKNVQPFDGQC